MRTQLVVLFVSAFLAGCAIVPYGTTTTTTVEKSSDGKTTTTTTKHERPTPPPVVYAPAMCWDPWWNVMRPCAPYGAVIVPQSSIYLRFGGGGHRGYGHRR